MFPAMQDADVDRVLAALPAAVTAATRTRAASGARRA
jgi:hypothetical protein